MTEAGPQATPAGRFASGPREASRAQARSRVGRSDTPDRAMGLRDMVSTGRSLLGVGWRTDRAQMTKETVFMSLRGVLGGISMAMLIPIVQSVGNGAAAKVRLGRLISIDLGRTPLAVLLLVFILLVAVSALIQRRATINAAKLQPLIIDEMRQEAFDAILAADWLFVISRRRSDIIEAVTSGANRCGAAFGTLLAAISSSALLLAMSVLALIVAPLLALVALTGITVLVTLRLLATKRTSRSGRETLRASRNLQGVIQDSMDSMRLVRAHDSAAVWQERLGEAFLGARENQQAQVRQQANITAGTTIALSSAAALLVLIAEVMSVPAASIALILILTVRIAGLAQSLSLSLTQLSMSLPSVVELQELTHVAREAAETPSTGSSSRQAPIDRSSGPLVEFQGVRFFYPETVNGVDDLTLSIESGLITVLTGPSGAGKSTTADLALGLLRPDRGTILVDGSPLVPEDLSWWRSHVAYVPQETVLLPGTLRENLTWSVRDQVTDDDCWDALDRAAAAFARRLPDGLDTVLGDAGIRLSGGERQRISIARALLRRPTLLVLDEATSSLDVETESSILDLMRSLTPSMTLLVIAHRTSTIAAGDRVIRLDGGRKATSSLIGNSENK